MTLANLLRMSTTKVRASVLHGAKDLRVEERELPELGADDVRVAVKATGLCGSDLHYFTHYRNGDILVREPLTLGHESAGVVTAVGANASDKLAVGDHVALEVGQPCGRCWLCASSRYNICRDMKFRSSAKAFPHAQGTLQDEIVHPAAWCHKLPSDLPLELGALAEPLSVAMHAADRAALPAVDASAPSAPSSVLVLGAGAVGLLCAAVSKAAGFRVIVADIQADRVDYATSHGFADAGVVVPLARPTTIEDKLAYAQELADTVKSTPCASPDGVAATYECTGVESCMQAAIYATAPGGKVLMIGMGTPVQTLPLSAAALREVDLVGVFRYANTYPRALDLLASSRARAIPGLPDLSALITQRYRGLDAVSEAFATAAKVKDDKGDLVLKVMLET